MKIYIAGEFKAGPWGGGNQFLKALRGFLREVDAYAEDLDGADVVLANGHQWGPFLFRLFAAKCARPELVILHRVDGPMAVVRARPDNSVVDDAIIDFNRHFADGTIFQSRWSRDLCIAHGMDARTPAATILNAPDPSIFHPPAVPKPPGHKIRIVSTSWSSNWKKGFDVFEYLDQNLDFSRYEYTFIGNSPIVFRNIRHIPPVASDVLAEELRRHDLFLQASHIEACSNSLIEAMNCGLIPVARDNSSHPEIVGEAGVLYQGVEDVLAAIETAVNNRGLLLRRMPQSITLQRVGRAYLEFAASLSPAAAKRPGLTALLRTWVACKLARRPGIGLRLKRLLGMCSQKRPA